MLNAGRLHLYCLTANGDAHSKRLRRSLLARKARGRKSGVFHESSKNIGMIFSAQVTQNAVILNIPNRQVKSLKSQFNAVIIGSYNPVI
jgi:hypothetical protein